MFENAIIHASYDLLEGSIISGVGLVDGKLEELPAYSDGMVVVYFPDGFDIDEAFDLGFSDEWLEAANDVLLENELVDFTYREFSEIVGM